MNNKTAYESAQIVNNYSKDTFLYKPEMTIFNMFKDRFKDFVMLDIGVGGGRTAIHFSNIVKEYTGIDYSVSMINECKEKFKDTSFKVCDARSMPEFESNYFDFILFSFNGIDAIPSYNERIAALKEIKRIGKEGGFFFFSTHNLQSVDHLFEYRLNYKHPRESVYNFINYIKTLFYNRSLKKLKKLKFDFIRDVGENFKINNFYIKPAEQVKQLKDIGFKNICLYSLVTGEKISENEIDSVIDSWIYYLCNI